MTVYQVGEVVDITIRSAKVVNSYPQRKRNIDGQVLVERRVLVVAVSGTESSVALNLNSTTVSVERVGPVDWPPQEGDLWTDGRNCAWFAYTQYDDDAPPKLLMHSDDPYGFGSDVRPDDVARRHGPMTLAYRKASALAPSDGDGPR